jgi:uncharacterized protein (UPF0335 family)
MTSNFTGSKLRSLIARVEGLEVQKAETQADIKEVFAEAKSFGFDPKIMRKVIALRKLDAFSREEELALVELYMAHVGMALGGSLSDRARKFAEQAPKPEPEFPNPSRSPPAQRLRNQNSTMATVRLLKSRLHLNRLSRPQRSISKLLVEPAPMRRWKTLQLPRTRTSPEIHDAPCGTWRGVRRRGLTEWTSHHSCADTRRLRLTVPITPTGRHSEFRRQTAEPRRDSHAGRCHRAHPASQCTRGRARMVDGDLAQAGTRGIEGKAAPSGAALRPARLREDHACSSSRCPPRHIDVECSTSK